MPPFGGKINYKFYLENASNLTHEFLFDNFNKKGINFEFTINDLNYVFIYHDFIACDWLSPHHYEL